MDGKDVAERMESQESNVQEYSPKLKDRCRECSDDGWILLEGSDDDEGLRGERAASTRGVDTPWKPLMLPIQESDPEPAERKFSIETNVFGSGSLDGERPFPRTKDLGRSSYDDDCVCRKPRRTPRVTQEPMDNLRLFAMKLKAGKFNNIFHTLEDPKGNRMSWNSTGHIHHPRNLLSPARFNLSDDSIPSAAASSR